MECVQMEEVDEGHTSVKREEDNGYTEECDAGMGQRDEVVGGLGSEATETTVSES